MTVAGREALSYGQALTAALAAEMRADARIFCIGTAMPPELAREFGPQRMRISPISEAAMTGVAVGAALSGKRPVVLWRNVTFSFVAFDQVVNQAAKARYMSGGQVSLPIVFRAPCGGGFSLAAQHSQSPHSIFAQVAGLKVIMPSDPVDAAGLLRSAIRDDNPVISLEPSRLEALEADVPPDHLIPLGVAAVKRAGEHVTVVGFGAMVDACLRAADELAGEGISTEVIDPRTVAPLDIDAIRASVRRTGRLVVADEAPAAASMASEVAAGVLEDPETFAALERPCVRVSAAPVPVAYSPPLERLALPDAAAVATAVREAVGG